MARHEFKVDMHDLDLTKFDVILGMDWLLKYHAQIDCLK